MSYPNTGAPEWAGPQASPWAPVNETQFIFDAFASRSIIEDRDLTAPPVSCDNGARYLIDTPATGLWGTHDGKLAIAIGADASNGWYFATVALHGNQLFVRDEDLLIEHDGAAWVTAPGGVSVLNDLTDVDAPTPTPGDVLTFDGADWVSAAPSGLSLPVVATDADDYTVLAADNAKYIRLTGAGTKDIFVQDDATEPLPANGEWHFRNVGAGDATFDDTDVTINIPIGGSLVIEQGGTVTLKRVATDEFDLIGVTAP